MAAHEHYALADHVVGDVHGLFRVAGVIADLQLQLLAVHAASGVDVGNGLLGALPELFAESGILASHRACNANGDLRQRGGGRQHRGNAQRHAGQQKFLHTSLPCFVRP